MSVYSLNVLVKPASGACNMRCGYCFYMDEMKNRGQGSYGMMSLETLDQMMRRIFECAPGPVNIAFQGGEPTLSGLPFFQSFIEYEKKYNVRHIPVSHALQTNGLLLDEDWCLFLKENHFLVGISIDGTKAVHDTYRKDTAGRDTYFRVLESAKLLQKADIPFNVLTVINSKTAPAIGRIYRSYEKLDFKWQQYIACLEPIPAGDIPGIILSPSSVKTDYALTPGIYGRFLIELFDLWEQDFYAGHQPYIRSFENYVGILMGIDPEACEQRGFCSMQNVIEADGSIYPCDFYVLDQYRLGNVYENSFEEVLDHWKEQHVLHFKPLPERCRTCEYFSLCRGGCLRHRDYSPDGTNIFCESYRMFFDARLSRLQKIAALCNR